MRSKAGKIVAGLRRLREQEGVSPLSVIRWAYSWMRYKLWSVNLNNRFARVQLYLKNVEYGKNLCVYGRIRILKHPESVIRIGDDVLLKSSDAKYFVNLYTSVKLVTWKASSRIVIGNGCDLNGTSIACRSTSITIGDHTIIAGNCSIMDTDWHVIAPINERTGPHAREVSSDQPIVIKENVWIGLNCVILKGVTIGRGSIIGAGSVVTKDIPDMVIAGGVPARVIREIMNHEERPQLDGLNHSNHE